MVYARRFEEARAKRKSRDAKGGTSFDGGCSNNRLEIQDKARFNKKFSNQRSFKLPRGSGDGMSNPKFMKEKGTNSPNENRTCEKSYKNHYGDCLKGTNNWFSCGNTSTR